MRFKYQAVFSLTPLPGFFSVHVHDTPQDALSSYPGVIGYNTLAYYSRRPTKDPKHDDMVIVTYTPAPPKEAANG